MARQKRKGKVRIMRIDINKRIFDKLDLYLTKLNTLSDKKIYIYEVVEKALDFIINYDLFHINRRFDKMKYYVDETENEKFGYEINDVEKILRKIKCESCAGSDSKSECKVRDDFECPSGKESKKKEVE